MTLTITALSRAIGARVTGISLAQGIDEADFEKLRNALDEHLVLVLANQPLDDELQIAFSERFGPLERTIASNPAAGTAFARQSNIDIKTGETIAPDDRRIRYQKANMLWHADSTYKPVLSLCSILTARVVPPQGGATEFASTRAAYEALAPEQQQELDGLEVEHDLVYSRRLVDFEFTPEEAAEMPPARHRLVQTNPTTGRKSVLIGAHAKSIVGWSTERSRALLDDLEARATRPHNCYRHNWATDDLVIWDNRSALHRATPFDTTKHRRLMQRTTVSSARQGRAP